MAAIKKRCVIANCNADAFKAGYCAAHFSQSQTGAAPGGGASAAAAARPSVGAGAAAPESKRGSM